MGSYVPADAAEMYCLDGVYTRMGAGDDLAADMSTFMVRSALNCVNRRLSTHRLWMVHTIHLAKECVRSILVSS